MKKIIFLLVALACSMAELKAQHPFSTRANTGDTEMDAILKDVDAKAQNDVHAFSTDVSKRFNVAKANVDEAVKVMAPGDVFMAAQVASISNKPFEEVTKTFQANKDKGWGEIAKEMGIKPGSPAFHEMKKSMKSNGNSGGKGNGKGGNGKGKGNSEKGEKGGKGGKGKK